MLRQKHVHGPQNKKRLKQLTPHHTRHLATNESPESSKLTIKLSTDDDFSTKKRTIVHFDHNDDIVTNNLLSAASSSTKAYKHRPKNISPTLDLLNRLQDPEQRAKLNPKILETSADFKVFPKPMATSLPAYTAMSVYHGHMGLNNNQYDARPGQWNNTTDVDNVEVQLAEYSRVKPGWDIPSPAEMALRQYWPNTRMFPGYMRMREAFVGKSISISVPKANPLLSAEELWDHNNDVRSLLDYHNLYDPRFIAPDPYVVEEEKCEPVIQAFSRLPTIHQLQHPDYKKFVLWYYWPEYRQTVLDFADTVDLVEKQKPWAYRAGLAVGSCVNVMMSIHEKFVELSDNFFRMIGTPGATWSATKSIGRSIGDELKHMYHGFKDLGSNVAVCAHILRRRLKGQEMLRSERKLLVRTVGDLLRIIPLIIILVIPFLEFALPVLLKLFPNMLPSTFADKKAEKEKQRQEFKARIELASFLQETVGTMTLKQLDTRKENLDDKLTAEMRDMLKTKVKQQRKRQEGRNDDSETEEGTEDGTEESSSDQVDEGTEHVVKSKKVVLKDRDFDGGKSQSENDETLAAIHYGDEVDDDDTFVPARPPPLVQLLDDVFQRLQQGEEVDSDQLQPLLKIYKNALSLELMESDQLLAMCQFMKLSQNGTPEAMRKRIEKKLAELREDDIAIEHEGVDKLTLDDLRDSCRERGMRYVGLSKRQLQHEMKSWIKLSVHLRLPASLLIFSRAIAMVNNVRADERFDDSPYEINADLLQVIASGSPSHGIGEILPPKDGITPRAAPDRLETLSKLSRLIEEESKKLSEESSSDSTEDSLPNKEVHDIINKHMSDAAPLVPPQTDREPQTPEAPTVATSLKNKQEEAATPMVAQEQQHKESDELKRPSQTQLQQPSSQEKVSTPEVSVATAAALATGLVKEVTHTTADVIADAPASTATKFHQHIPTQPELQQNTTGTAHVVQMTQKIKEDGVSAPDEETESTSSTDTEIEQHIDNLLDNEEKAILKRIHNLQDQQSDQEDLMEDAHLYKHSNSSETEEVSSHVDVVAADETIVPTTPTVATVAAEDEDIPPTTISPSIVPTKQHKIKDITPEVSDQDINVDAIIKKHQQEVDNIQKNASTATPATTSPPTTLSPEAAPAMAAAAAVASVLAGTPATTSTTTKTKPTPEALEQSLRKVGDYIESSEEVAPIKRTHKTYHEQTDDDDQKRRHNSSSEELSEQSTDQLALPLEYASDEESGSVSPSDDGEKGSEEQIHRSEHEVVFDAKKSTKSVEVQDTADFSLFKHPQHHDESRGGDIIVDGDFVELVAGEDSEDLSELAEGAEVRRLLKDYDSDSSEGDENTPSEDGEKKVTPHEANKQDSSEEGEDVEAMSEENTEEEMHTQETIVQTNQLISKMLDKLALDVVEVKLQEAAADPKLQQAVEGLVSKTSEAKQTEHSHTPPSLTPSQEEPQQKQ